MSRPETEKLKACHVYSSGQQQSPYLHRERTRASDVGDKTRPTRNALKYFLAIIGDLSRISSAWVEESKGVHLIVQARETYEKEWNEK